MEFVTYCSEMYMAGMILVSDNQKMQLWCEPSGSLSSTGFKLCRLAKVLRITWSFPRAEQEGLLCCVRKKKNI